MCPYLKEAFWKTNLIFRNQYTQSFLSYRKKSNATNVTSFATLMRGEKRKMVPYSPGENGITDSLSYSRIV